MVINHVPANAPSHMRQTIGLESAAACTSMYDGSHPWANDGPIIVVGFDKQVDGFCGNFVHRHPLAKFAFGDNFGVHHLWQVLLGSENVPRHLRVPPNDLSIDFLDLSHLTKIARPNTHGRAVELKVTRVK